MLFLKKIKEIAKFFFEGSLKYQCFLVAPPPSQAPPQAGFPWQLGLPWRLGLRWWLGLLCQPFGFCPPLDSRFPLAVRPPWRPARSRRLRPPLVAGVPIVTQTHRQFVCIETFRSNPTLHDFAHRYGGNSKLAAPSLEILKINQNVFNCKHCLFF